MQTSRTSGTVTDSVSGRTAVNGHRTADQHVPTGIDVVDLFSGPGGLDLSAQDEGLRVHGIEYDPDTCATRRAAGLTTTQGSVRDYGPEDFPGASVLSGGPPCQTFTVTGNGVGRALLNRLRSRARSMAAREVLPPTPLDERSLLVLEPLRWVLAAKDAGHPYEAIVLEQVDQVLPMWETYVELLRAEGYKAACGVVRAEEYGAPQTRRRAVLLAVRKGFIGLPAATHRPWRRNLSEVERYLQPTVVMSDVLPHRGDFTVISNYGTGGDPKKRGRRHCGEPAATVTGKINRNRIVNPDGSEQDRLSPAEAGILQGFPADFPWSGRNPWQQIGNAVPVPLGRALFRSVLKSIENCPCGHEWINHRIAAPHPCKECACRGWFDRQTEEQNR